MGQKSSKIVGHHLCTFPNGYGVLSLRDQVHNHKRPQMQLNFSDTIIKGGGRLRQPWILVAPKKVLCRDVVRFSNLRGLVVIDCLCVFLYSFLISQIP